MEVNGCIVLSENATVFRCMDCRYTVYKCYTVYAVLLRGIIDFLFILHSNSSHLSMT